MQIASTAITIIWLEILFYPKVTATSFAEDVAKEAKKRKIRLTSPLLSGTTISIVFQVPQALFISDLLLLFVV